MCSPEAKWENILLLPVCSLTSSQQTLIPVRILSRTYYTVFAQGFLYFNKGSDLIYDCGRMLSRRDRQAYCLYIRQPHGRRITNSFSGRPPNPHQNENTTWTAVLRYRRKRGTLQPRIKPKWSLCGSPKATTTALKEDPKKQI